MATDPQTDVIAFLSRKGAFGADVEAERIDTHISIVWLAGARAYKLKRAVQYDYVDFSSLERRRAACEAEVALNRRTAPALYRGVIAVTREDDGSLALAGHGAPVEWLVEMTRFDQQTLFDRLADRRQLERDLMPGLAAAIAMLHAGAERIPGRSGLADMAWVIDGNALGFSEQGAPVLDQSTCVRLNAAARRSLAQNAARLDRRGRDGFIRRCHGDLHLRNICLIDGVPTIFDGVEFNDNIACIDVFYDLAFLLMDLWRRGLRDHANVVFNEYVDRTGDVDALELLPLFLSCRAAVRAKTSVSGSRVQPDPGQRRTLEEAARDYLALAEAFLRPPGPQLIAVGGFSGTGKSTLARALAPEAGPAPGALLLRSDVIRKGLLGVPSLTRLGPDGYAPDVSRQVYDAIATGARVALRARHTVIADAVYADPRERAAIAKVAGEVGVPFVGLWLEAAPQLLVTRLNARRDDASDATTAVLQQQLTTGAGEVEWSRLDASSNPGQVASAAAKFVASSRA
jgi:aminoglycoside phosphotransferase family enzyme/predicted kinase